MKEAQSEADRQRKVRRKIKEVAQSLGFKSITQFCNAILNQSITVTITENIKDQDNEN